MNSNIPTAIESELIDLFNSIKGIKNLIQLTKAKKQLFKSLLSSHYSSIITLILNTPNTLDTYREVSKNSKKQQFLKNSFLKFL